MQLQFPISTLTASLSNDLDLVCVLICHPDQDESQMTFSLNENLSLCCREDWFYISEGKGSMPLQKSFFVERFTEVELKLGKINIEEMGEGRAYEWDLREGCVEMDLDQADGEWVLRLFADRGPKISPLDFNFSHRSATQTEGSLFPVPDDGGLGMTTVLAPPAGFYRRGDSGVKPALRRFFQTMIPHIHAQVMVRSNEDALRLSEIMEELGVDEKYWQAQQVGADRLREWVRDQLVPGQEGRGGKKIGRFLSPFDANAQKAIQMVMKNLGFLQLPAHFPVEGGNLIVGKHHVLIGKNCVVEWARVYNQTLEEAQEQIARILNTPQLIVIGTKEPIARHINAKIPHMEKAPENYQPAVHIDLFLALLGQREGGMTELAFGRPDFTKMEDQFSREMRLIFDKIAEQLLDAGLLIHDIPLPFVAGRVGSWFASSTNVLLGHEGDRRVLWLPQYGNSNHP